MSEPLWRPTEDRRRQANLTAFMEWLAARDIVRVAEYAELYAWSIRHPARFWEAVWDFTDVRAVTRGERALVDENAMPGARWFPEARLNYAQNLLRRHDETDAVVFWGEGGRRSRLSHAALYEHVSKLASALGEAGVAIGDRVAGYLPNIPEAVVGAIATASLGAVWSSCSPDFGPQGMLDRFGQIEPTVLIAADGYLYNGKRYDCLPVLRTVIPSLPSLKLVLVVPFLRDPPPIADLPKARGYHQVIDSARSGDVTFVDVPFDHPLFVLYSSGTTGVPKCIVHGVGGTLLQHLKEHRLHCDIQPGDRVFYFTTCGWMMWNWLLSALASEATLLLYDGSPTYPRADVLFDYADAEGMTLFGTSAKYLDAIHKIGARPIDTHRLESLRTLTSTGSPLIPERFDTVYREIKTDVHLASISGGTDLISCFALGNPVAPVYRGELQTRGLGMRVEVFGDDGRPVRGRAGELVCTAPFPSMPVGFWNDPDGRRYREAYFERFPNVWCHGDWVELTEHDGLIIHGRSDAVLNPGGVRIGTAEIYRQVEQLEAVLESICVGQEWEGDVRIVLFVRLRKGLTLNDELRQTIVSRLRTQCSPRHVPAKIVQVAEVPRTRSGKITELAVRDVIHGRPVENIGAVANPDALDLYRDLEALRS